MNQTQRKYAIKRVEGIAEKRKSSIIRDHTVSANTLTNAQKYTALRKGEFKVRKEGANRYVNEWHNFITFNAERSSVIDQVTIDAKTKKLDKAVQRVTDEIMLGDSEVAMKLIAKFEQDYS